MPRAGTSLHSLSTRSRSSVTTRVSSRSSFGNGPTAPTRVPAQPIKRSDAVLVRMADRQTPRTALRWSKSHTKAEWREFYRELKVFPISIAVAEGSTWRKRDSTSLAATAAGARDASEVGVTESIAHDSVSCYKAAVRATAGIILAAMLSLALAPSMLSAQPTPVDVYVE